MSLIPGAASAPSIHAFGVASGSTVSPTPLLLPYGMTGNIGNVRSSSSTAQTLVNDDNDIQIFTPTAAHDVNLPTTDVASGRAFYIVNKGGYALTIKSSNGNTVVDASTGTVTNGVYLVRSLQATPTTSAHWMIESINEVGTFLPVVKGTSTAGTYTYTAQLGTYTRVFNKAFISIYMNWSSAGTDGTGNMQISNIPFTSAATYLHGTCIGYVNNISLTASNYLFAYVTNSAINIDLQQMSVGGGTASSVPIDHSGTIVLSAFYNV